MWLIASLCTEWRNILYEVTWFRIGLPGNSILLAQARKLMRLIARYRKVKRNLSSITGIDLQIKKFQYETLKLYENLVVTLYLVLVYPTNRTEMTKWKWTNISIVQLQKQNSKGNWRLTKGNQMMMMMMFTISFHCGRTSRAGLSTKVS